MKQMSIIILFLNLFLFFTNCKKNDPAVPTNIAAVTPYDKCTVATAKLTYLVDTTKNINYSYTVDTTKIIKAGPVSNPSAYQLSYYTNSRVKTININASPSIIKDTVLNGSYSYTYASDGKLQLIVYTNTKGVLDSAIHQYTSNNIITYTKHHYVNGTFTYTALGRLELDNNGNIAKHYSTLNDLVIVGPPNIGGDTLHLIREYEYLNTISPTGGYLFSFTNGFMDKDYLFLFHKNLISKITYHEFFLGGSPGQYDGIMTYAYQFDSNNKLTEIDFTYGKNTLLTPFQYQKMTFNYTCQ